MHMLTRPSPRLDAILAFGLLDSGLAQVQLIYLRASTSCTVLQWLCAEKQVSCKVSLRESTLRQSEAHVQLWSEQGVVCYQATRLTCGLVSSTPSFQTHALCTATLQLLTCRHTAQVRLCQFIHWFKLCKLTDMTCCWWAWSNAVCLKKFRISKLVPCVSSDEQNVKGKMLRHALTRLTDLLVVRTPGIQTGAWLNHNIILIGWSRLSAEEQEAVAHIN